MKKTITSITLGLAISLGTVSAQVTDENGRKRSESPFFEILGKRGETETLPLLSTNADVNIAGVIADVKVTQVYVNRGSTPIEASYIFPASSRAAVYDMQFVLGKRTVKAQIMESQKAQQTYTKAKSEGKTASLLQQFRPNVFQMNLANIMPGDTIKVEMFYTELLLSENGIYEFAYPTVVGPRYTGDAHSKTKEASFNPKYLNEGEKPTYLFDIKTKINAGVPISDLTCTSHNVNTIYEEPSVARIELSKEDVVRGNKDFILKFRLTGAKMQNGMLVYEGKDENYFLMMMQPPKVVSKTAQPAKEYVFIMDVSGSQSGFPLEVSKVLMKNLLKNLGPKDKFNLLVFEGYSGFWSPASKIASEKNISDAVAFVDKQTAGGGTEMLSAIKKAMTFPHSKNYSRTFVIATDGFISFEKDNFDYIRANLGAANFFAFGIGSSVNRFLVEGIARAGMGEPFIVTNEKEAKIAAEKFRTYISNPVLTNIKVSYDGFEVYDLVTKHVPDVFSLRPIVLFGKYKGAPAGTIHISGINGFGNFSASINVAEAKAGNENKALRYLWARNKIRELDDRGQIGNVVKKQVTDLGLKYNLLTAYTSFVAVDDEIRNKNGNADSIGTVLPLPHGVSNNAVGVNGGYSGLGICSGNAVTFTSVSGGTGATTYSWNSTNAPTAVSNCTGTYALSVTDGSGCNSTTKTVLEDKKILTDLSITPKMSKKPALPEGKKESEAGYFAEGLKPAEKLPIIRPEKKETALFQKQQITLSGEVLPEFKGGDEALKKFLKSNLVYPASAKKNGMVFVKFTVDKNGKLKNISILHGLENSIDAEALRVAKLMPAWIPGKKAGVNKEMEYTLGIKF
ncbi:MAG: TonB family protein [Bacteroidia bacterium]|nr:TonB family protein [Bacteroidia bacterium]